MPPLIVSKQDSAFNLNRQFIIFFSLGNKRMIGDFFWIKTLIESDLEKYTKKDKNSWMYHRFRTIAELDPSFYENYLWGGMFLSVVKDDIFGADEIYSLGLQRYPSDYRLNFNAGFNSYFELGDFQMGARRLDKIKDHPEATELVRLIFNKLQFELNHDFDTAISFLKIRYQSVNDERIKEKILKDIKLLQIEKDLECLNQKLKNCSTIDPYGKSYSFNPQLKTWESSIKSRYKIFRRKS